MSTFQIIDNSTTNPFVSVAMLSYNHEKYIRESIDSVLNQITTFEYVLIVAEDYSTDNTRNIILEYQKKYPNRVKLILQNINVGASKNNIALLSSLEGKYVAAIEGDDYWTDPLKLQKQVDFLEQNKDYALHCSNALVIDGPKQTPTHHHSKSFNAFDILNKNFTYTASLCFRKEDILIPNFLEKSPAGDWLLILYALRKKKGYFSKDVTCAYRIHEGGIWSQLDKENKKAIKKRFENLKANTVIYQHISKDKLFDSQVRYLAKKKQESYAYQAKRMTILYPFLSFNSNDLEPKTLASFAKLKFTQLKTVFN